MQLNLFFSEEVVLYHAMLLIYQKAIDFGGNKTRERTRGEKGHEDGKEKAY